MNKEDDGIWHEVLHRDKGYCQYCGADLLAGPLAFFSATVDYVLPKRAGGVFTVDNLVLCCRGCNGILSRQKHLQTFQERRAHVRKTLLDGLPPVPPTSKTHLWYLDELTKGLQSRMEGETVIPTRRAPQQSFRAAEGAVPGTADRWKGRGGESRQARGGARKVKNGADPIPAGY